LLGSLSSFTQRERFYETSSKTRSSRSRRNPIYPPMAKDIKCPTCDGPLMINGDEKVGDEVFCTSCPGVYKVALKDTESFEVEEDY
jgi:hypothetical protein